MRQLILFLLCFSFHLSAANNQVGNGLLAYGNETYDSLQVNGYAKLHGTVVTQLLQVNGNLTASEAKIGELQVHGQASLNNCTVSKKTTVYGTVAAVVSTFEQEVTLASDDSSFESCSLSSVRVMKSKNPQTITLGGTTTLTGLITFESGKGTVVVSGDSPIKPSSIVGGKLQKSAN